MTDGSLKKISHTREPEFGIHVVTYEAHAVDTSTCEEFEFDMK